MRHLKDLSSDVLIFPEQGLHASANHLKDFDSIHNELEATDPHFASVPISLSEESELLRLAHGQQVISGLLCDLVWQPFSSEKTFQQPDFAANLSTISMELEKSSPGGRRAKGVWAALTMRALHSLSVASKASSDEKFPETPTSGRVEELVSKVFHQLKALVSPSQEAQFRSDLVALGHSAISAWSCAQTDELQITVCPTLEMSNANAWRSHVFDPIEDDTAMEIKSSAHPRILTLFPSVTAKKALPVAKVSAGPPGSWPEPDGDTAWEEICIHPGSGLRECSTLVINGKAEEEERKAEEKRKEELLAAHRKEVEKEFKESQLARSQKIGHGRRKSTADSSSGPPSPTAQWRNNGGSRVVEEY